MDSYGDRCVFAYSFIISRAFQQVSMFKIVGSYWLGFIQYSVLLLPISNLAVYILTFLGASLSTAIDSIGLFMIVAFYSFCLRYV